MNFFLNNKRFSVFIFNYNLRTLYFIVILFSLLIFFIGLSCHYAVNFCINNIKNEINVMELTIAAHEQAKKNELSLQERLQELNAEIIKYGKKKSVKDRLFLIIELAQKHGLSLVSYAAADRIEKEDYIKIVLQFQIKGSLDQFVQFLDRLSASEIGVISNHLSFSHQAYLVDASLHLTLITIKEN